MYAIRSYYELAVIEVEDNAGAYCQELKEGGLGMTIVDRRIKNLYGERFGLSIACADREWTRVAVTSYNFV